MSGDVRLVEDLVARFPVFEDAYDAHVDNMDGVLPHVFFWDVTQDVVRSFVGQRPDADLLDWRAVLDFLEEQLRRGIPEVTEVITTSFLHYLPFPSEPGHELVGHLGPAMARKFKELRPGG